jgi:hypothetical protein
MSRVRNPPTGKSSQKDKKGEEGPSTHANTEVDLPPPIRVEVLKRVVIIA